MLKHGNVSNVESIQSIKSIKKKRIYDNVNTDTNPSHRSKVISLIQSNELVDWMEPTDHFSYLQELSIYQWAISPRGNGVDCHRVWECLYAKCVPLVDDTINTRAFQKMGFPMILIQDWNSITLELLESETSKLNFDSHKLDLEYWKTLFHSF